MSNFCQRSLVGRRRVLNKRRHRVGCREASLQRMCVGNDVASTFVEIFDSKQKNGDVDKHIPQYQDTQRRTLLFSVDSCSSAKTTTIVVVVYASTTLAVHTTLRSTTLR